MAKTIGQHIDHTIAQTKQHAARAHKKVKQHAKRLSRTKKRTQEEEKGAVSSLEHEKQQLSQSSVKLKRTLFFLGALVLILIILLFMRTGGDQEGAQSIARMLAADEVPIRGISVTRDGYEVVYAAEDAVGRFDDALLHDWGMIYGTVAAHDCKRVTITTTLDSEPYHRQTVGCDAVRAFVRGILEEHEFQALIEHENLA